MAGRRGIMLLAFGGPESSEDVEGFLQSLLGRIPPVHLVEEVKERYRRIGGRSPLPGTTRAQARALAERLAADGNPLPVHAAFRHSRPGVAETLGAMAEAGIGDIAVIGMAPYRSAVSTADYEAVVREALGRIAPQRRPAVRFAPDWYGHPGFIKALAEQLASTLEALPAERRRTAAVIFSAHALPVKFLEAGDPYARQLEATARAVAAELGLANWRLAYQSKGAAPIPWSGPQVEEVLEELAAAGEREVVVDPIGFVTDHLETLYDNDIVHKAHAERLGLRFLRCPCPGVAPAFIAALADIARATLELIPPVGGEVAVQ